MIQMNVSKPRCSHTNVPEMSNITSDSYISGTFCFSKVWSLILALLGWSIFLKMLNTCSTGAEESASAKYFLARLESAWKWASAVL